MPLRDKPQRSDPPTAGRAFVFLLLLHFDKTVGPFVLSDGGGAYGQFGPQTALVDVAD